MIAVIFEVWAHEDHRQRYLDLAAALRPLLSGIDGFISIERFQSLGDPGKLLSLSYWRDEAATARAIRDGWLHTGDLGVLDEDGFLFIVDRVKDVIISGGENIASSEVERVLYEHPDVSEAAVVARPDERWNEVPVAFCVRIATPPTVRSIMRFAVSGYSPEIRS